jgi:hypothetical protein
MAKVLVTFDEKLLARIDKAARSRGLSRSAYLSLLAARDVDASLGPGRTVEAQRALRRIDDLFATNRREVDTTAAVREERAGH